MICSSSEPCPLSDITVKGGYILCKNEPISPGIADGFFFAGFAEIANGSKEQRGELQLHGPAIFPLPFVRRERAPIGHALLLR